MAIKLRLEKFSMPASTVLFNRYLIFIIGQTTLFLLYISLNREDNKGLNNKKKHTLTHI